MTIVSSFNALIILFSFSLAHILKGSTSTSVIENLILGLVLLCKPDIEDLTVKIASANTLGNTLLEFT